MQLFFGSHRPLVAKNFSFLSQLLSPICTKTYDSAFSSDQTKVINDLITVFTGRKSFSPNNQELKSLGSGLTAEIVETVLKSLTNWKIAYKFFIWASEQWGYKHNVYAYNAMANILIRSRQNAPLRALALDIVKSRCSMSPGALGFFIRCLGCQGLVEEANSLFDQAKQMALCVPTSYSYNCLLEVISKSNSIDLIEMRLKEMRDFGWEPDKYTLTPVLHVYCKAGEFERALNIFNQIYGQNWADAHVFSILLLSFSKYGEIDMAFELIERMEQLNISLNEKTFYVLIHGFVRETRVDKALQLFDKMRKSGFSPDVSIYGALIEVLCKSNEMNKALHLYSMMKESGIYADTGILTNLISSSRGENEMIRLLEESGKDFDGEQLILLYNSILKCLVNIGSTDKAYSMLQTMIGHERHGVVLLDNCTCLKEIICPDATSFNIVLDGLCKTGNLDLALNLFHRMDSYGYKPNLLLFNNMIDSLNNSDRLEESYEVMRKMKESGFEPTQFTHNSIFGCLCRREDVEGALNMVRKMRVCGHEPWIKHYTFLVRQLCRNGRVLEAYDFLTSMSLEGFVPDIIAFSAVVDGFVRIKDLDRALELFRDISARGYHPDVVAYNILIKGFCKAQRMSDAHNLLTEMMDKGLIPSVVTYNLLIDGWCKGGEVDKAILCLSKMNAEERKPSVVTYTTLIDGLCNVGKPEDALKVWKEMKETGCLPSKISYMAIIHGLCKCNKPDTGLLFFNEMVQNEMKPDAFVYIALIGAFLSTKNPVLAFAILKEMVAEKNFPDPLEKIFLLLKDAILKLSEDAQTSLLIKNLTADGKIPANLSPF